MSSIATETGDGGDTGLIGGSRVSKGDLRVESLGSLDELNAALGLARSLCRDAEVAGWTEAIQRALFRVGGALATPSEERSQAHITAADVDALTVQVHELESLQGLLSDWSLPGAYVESAAFEVARTVCRRAERDAVRLRASGVVVPAEVLRYLNRLSDLIWLFGRLLEQRAKVDSRLRTADKAGPGWSRAW